MDGTRIASTLTRRHFIVTAATAAGGFVIGIGAVPRWRPAPPRSRRSPGTTTTPTPRTKSTPGSRSIPTISILIRYQRSEMGQGSMTALPMMINEELQCDWSKVRIEYASPNRNIRENKVYGDMFSNGSRSVRASQKKMQQVGASARERLIAGRRGALERAGDGMHGREQRRHAQALGPHAALRRTRRRRGEDHARQGAGDQDAGPVHLHPASRCRASTSCTRSTARPSSASTRRSPAWSSPRSRPARSPAASSRASMTRCSRARRAFSRS